MKKTKEEILATKRILIKEGIEWVPLNQAESAMQEYADLEIKEELEDLVESMKETYCEYHLAITEGELNDYKNKCK